MPCSMTSFARAEFSGEWGHGVWELRSVNHRYLEVLVRLPDEFRIYEGRIREHVGARAKRGKLDCTLRCDLAGRSFSEIRLNEQAADQVVDATRRIASIAGGELALNPFDVLRWPGVIETEDGDINDVSEDAFKALGRLLDEFVDTRRREGHKLKTIIEQRIKAIRSQIELLDLRVPDIINSIRERYEHRLHALAKSLDESRVEQECALLIQRLDVAEELDRLRAHVQEAQRLLDTEEPIGRHLDFLMQELNREANTLGSKSAHVDTAGASIELKVLIEQIREQVQNIE